MTDGITREEFNKHCTENMEMEKKLNTLMPMAELIPVLQEIAEEKRSMLVVGRKVMSFLKYFSIIIGAMLTLIYIYREINK